MFLHVCLYVCTRLTCTNKIIIVVLLIIIIICWQHGLTIVPTFVSLIQFLGSLGNGVPRVKNKKKKKKKKRKRERERERDKEKTEDWNSMNTLRHIQTPTFSSPENFHPATPLVASLQRQLLHCTSSNVFLSVNCPRLQGWSHCERSLSMLVCRWSTEAVAHSMTWCCSARLSSYFTSTTVVFVLHIVFISPKFNNSKYSLIWTMCLSGCASHWFILHSVSVGLCYVSESASMDRWPCVEVYGSMAPLTASGRVVPAENVPRRALLYGRLHTLDLCSNYCQGCNEQDSGVWRSLGPLCGTVSAIWSIRNINELSPGRNTSILVTMVWPTTRHVDVTFCDSSVLRWSAPFNYL